MPEISQPENFVPLYLNSGGGIFGAVRNALRKAPYYEILFGDRVFPGRAPQKTAMPYVVMSHVSCTYDDYMGIAYSSAPLPIETWHELIQVSVYADAYEASRQLGKIINALLSRHILVDDGMPVFLYPETRLTILESETSERGGDVWHVDHRYSFWSYEYIFEDDYDCPPTPPFNTIWPAADITGPPWDFEDADFEVQGIPPEE